MIPIENINEWAEKVAWSNMEMIEHDLVISKALVCLYSNPVIQEKLVFRGGTALNKLYLNPPSRYSEDIDFVQRYSEPAGQIITAIRASLDSWLGEPQRKFTQYGVKLNYRYRAANEMPMRLKIEINTTEHFNALDLDYREFDVDSGWFKGSSVITSYALEELMATKLRALFQRRKGRDLFDAWHIFGTDLVDRDMVIELFQKYCERGGTLISRKTFMDNMEQKSLNSDFREDITRLHPKGSTWNFDEAFELVQENVISKLP